MEKTRQFVPVLLNDKVVVWIFEDGEEEITIRIPVNKKIFTEGRYAYITEAHDITFVRRERLITTSIPMVEEIFYLCRQSSITFVDTTVAIIN
ncbi:hypothetical protein LCGC14_0475670 [marine sediment metagenome]|uniref:Uncharacterized protein n=1 Tax=marine sediment metagenome TaxID=412755 RepID=A0A0F9SGA4_9ZZZZ